MGEKPSLAARLDALERQGGNALVIGTVPTAVHAAVARKMLDGPERTRRLLVLSGRDVEGVDERLPPDAPRDASHLRIVEHGGVATVPDGVSEGAVRHVPDDDLPTLGTAISDTVETIEAVAGTLDPGELRVCFDSLLPITGEHSRADVFGFLHILIKRLERSDALGYYHLPVDRDDELVSVLESLFDGIVELRAADGDPQQRWIDGDDRSEWVPID